MRVSLVGCILACSLLFAAGCLRIGTSPKLTYFIDDGQGVAGYAPGDRGLAEWALADWARASGGRLRFVRARSAEAALIRVRWIPAGAGLYGEMERVIVGDRPGAIVNVSAAAAGAGGPLAELMRADPLLRDAIVYLTCVHELGHALGLQHTADFNDIMYAFGYGGDIVEYFSRYRRRLQSRADIARTSGLSAADVAALQAALDGEHEVSSDFR